MARYGKGGYNEWKENRVTSYDKKTEGAALGLKGWDGNKTIEYEAKQLAEQRGKPGADYGKGSIYWDMAETDLIRKGRKGGDVHSGRFAQENEDDMNYMRERIDALEKGGTPEADAEPAPEIRGTSRLNTTDSDRVAEAKERSSNFKDTYSTPFDDAEAELPEEDDSEKAAASFMSDYTLDLRDKMRNGTFNA